MAAALGGPVYDVYPGQPDHVAGPAVARALASKGFAVIGQDTGDSFTTSVQKDIQGIDASGKLLRPPELVAEGLLGGRGAVRICELSSPDVTPEEWEGASIGFADRLISQMGELLEPYTPELGFSIVGRTSAVLLETGEEPDDEPPELSEAEASKWLSTLIHGKLQLLQCLGPAVGSLELRVVGEEDMEPHFVQTVPGMIVVLRADTIIREHTSAEPSYILSSFACGEQLHWYKKPKGEDLHPAAKAIDQWILGRMLRMKQAVDHEDETALNPYSIPRSVQKVMNRMFVKGERAAVLGTSCKFSNAMDMETFHHTMGAAVDFAVEVPFGRWDHTEHYHPDLEGYHYGKVYCMHMTVAPDLEMFDNKFFLISPAEASKMDPCERQILEVGYEGLARGGLKKKDMMGSDCGIYVAWQSELALGSEDRGMGANRASFCLGCKGPSLACDVDHASALLAIKVASNELGRACNQGLAVGCAVCQSVASWIGHCGAHLLSPAGRTCSFDANASGFIRADSVSSMYMRRLKGTANDEDVWDDKVRFDGVILAATCKNQGRTASLRSVSGPCLQECFHEGIRQAKVSPLDIDIVECDAKADVMQDGVEVAATLRGFRPPGPFAGCDETIALGASKSYVGNSVMASGMATVLKGLAAGLYGNTPPIVHLNQINPLIHSEVFSQPINLPCECLDLNAAGGAASVTSMMACGWGGTNAQLLCWNKVDETRIIWGRPVNIDKPVFWPGGGGMLMNDEVPSQAYTIVGTWSSWNNPMAMEEEEPGVYGFTMTMGENCWEMFQIWLDGDEDRTLHPGRNRAPMATVPEGPERVGVHLNWLIDGRAVLEEGGRFAEEEEKKMLMLQAYGASGGADGLVELPHAERGWPGAQYRIRLRVAGRWRTVDWERISESPAGTALQDDSTRGRYYVVGSFNDWGFQEMSPDFVSAGVYNVEVMLYRNREYFQIVRNEDWQQMIFPWDRTRNEISPVGGPSDEGHGYHWELKGEAGDVFRIEFQRSMDETGFQSMKVSWRCVRSQTVDYAQLREARRTKYFIVGSWTGYKSRQELKPNSIGGYFSTEVTVRGLERFQILVNGNWGAVLHPKFAETKAVDDSRICGPTESAEGLEWLLGEDDSGEDDADRAERSYELRLSASATGMPLELTCTKL